MNIAFNSSPQGVHENSCSYPRLLLFNYRLKDKLLFHQIKLPLQKVRMLNFTFLLQLIKIVT